MSFSAKLRQLKFPKEFRFLPPLDYSQKLMPKLDDINESIRDYQKPNPNLLNTIDVDETQFFAEVATGLCRLKQRMLEPGTAHPLEEMRRIYRHLESTWETLNEAGIEIMDHINEYYDPGMSISVLAFQPTKGISRELIIETIKPTVYLKGKRIQMGEVIVGTPE
ncbi:MAG: hypothetical protein RBS43_07680 [Candidatus Cloacimonas sp.]|jgi:hypothetical protein|nr:hypothetical protein [Candidatus Cloacimonas sp.]